MAPLQASAEGHDVQVQFTYDLHNLSVQGLVSLEILNVQLDIDLSTLVYFEHALAVLFGHP